MSTFSALRDLPSYLILPFTLLHKGEIFEVGALSEQHSMEFQTPVRVVRGHANKLSYTGKLYTYDGIYQTSGNLIDRCTITGLRRVSLGFVCSNTNSGACQDNQI
jgi:hypothetical protein